jgi:hypothetical protein
MAMLSYVGRPLPKAVPRALAPLLIVPAVLWLGVAVAVVEALSAAPVLAVICMLLPLMFSGVYGAAVMLLSRRPRLGAVVGIIIVALNMFPLLVVPVMLLYDGFSGTSGGGELVNVVFSLPFIFLFVLPGAYLGFLMVQLVRFVRPRRVEVF